MKLPVLLVCILCLLVQGVSTNCGVKKHPDKEGKVLGGRPAIPGEYPWQISLQLPHFYGASHFCGGSLIDPYWILTAAHCVDRLSPGHVVVVAGESNLYVNNTHEQSARVASIIVHKKWKHEQGNDIALLKLQKPLVLGEFVGLICLPDKFEETNGTVTVTGWGSTSEGGPISEDLMTVDVSVLSDEHCRTEYSRNEIQDSMICAAVDEGGKDSCQGDSGGPLIAKYSTNELYYLVGIVSWGIGCGEPGKAGVYTQVSYFREWIQENSRI